MRRLCCALGCVAGLAIAGCGDDPEPSRAEGGGTEFVSKVDATCQETQDASRAGPRFPYRTFDPTNPDRRQRAVGRFYVKLDTEGTLGALSERLRAMSPPPALRAGHDRMVADFNAFACALTLERWAKALR